MIFGKKKPTLRFVLIEHRNKKRQLCCPIRKQDGRTGRRAIVAVLSNWIWCDSNAIFSHISPAEILIKFNSYVKLKFFYD